jgi:hypothetical protein
MTQSIYEKIAYGLHVTSTRGTRGVHTLEANGDAGNPAQGVREAEQLGAEKVGQITATWEQRVATTREALALQRGDLTADQNALEEAQANVADDDHAVQDDRFVWSPVRATLVTLALLVVASPVLMLTNRDRPLNGVVLVCGSALAAMVAQLTGRAFGKAAGERPRIAVVTLGVLALLVVVVCAALARHSPLAASIGIAVAASAFVLGWLAGRHDHVVPRQQRVQRVAALQHTIASHEGAVASLDSRLRDERREAEAAIAQIRAITIRACAVRCSTVAEVTEADRLLTLAETTINGWQLPAEEIR